MTHLAQFRAHFLPSPIAVDRCALRVATLGSDDLWKLSCKHTQWPPRCHDVAMVGDVRHLQPLQFRDDLQDVLQECFAPRTEHLSGCAWRTDVPGPFSGLPPLLLIIVVLPVSLFLGTASPFVIPPVVVFIGPAVFLTGALSPPFVGTRCPWWLAARTAPSSLLPRRRAGVRHGSRRGPPGNPCRCWSSSCSLSALIFVSSTLRKGRARRVLPWLASLRRRRDICYGAPAAPYCPWTRTWRLRDLTTNAVYKCLPARCDISALCTQSLLGTCWARQDIA